ncbi:uncharacterized protein LACBIDRAFT_334047 [Laccaria bicolor S238N-H82]|uniref:Predicted protein n=1 Tax=Laccaria bicolor (strain S238N-H82 / ATCC MYA-4686) TaxID=486041 RepID=B0DXX2_LACBS|nr:uncharacterized protein LACBIDRAFT_334047 [Laccaria bicolor S238N-H82]EDR00588.1 predicted protein [Laccaria bicolor S238N-H82]|eukprot:XP_001888815.1 predicted protein [Laccaria bicolor S238N-H82]
MTVILTLQLPTEACIYDREDGGDLAWCAELFETVLASLGWASLVTPATSAMERPFKADVVGLWKRNIDDQRSLLPHMKSGVGRVAGWEFKDAVGAKGIVVPVEIPRSMALVNEVKRAVTVIESSPLKMWLIRSFAQLSLSPWSNVLKVTLSTSPTVMSSVPESDSWANACTGSSRAITSNKGQSGSEAKRWTDSLTNLSFLHLAKLLLKIKVLPHAEETN